MQNRTVRLNTAAFVRGPCKILFKRLKILSLSSLFILQNFLFVKCNQKMFFGNNHLHYYFTRNSNPLQYIVHGTSILENSHCYSCLRVCNKLPPKIEKKEKFFIKFKTMSREYFFSHGNYRIYQRT